MDQHIEHPDGERLAAYWARPAGTGAAPVVVLCHDFPTMPRGSVASGLTFPELADRIASRVGWRALTFNFRGTGGSDGDFSIAAWLEDLRLVVNEATATPDTEGVCIVGTGLGASLALVVGAADPRVRGIAALGAPLGLRDWARDPARFLRHCRQLGAVRSERGPADLASWAAEMAAVDTIVAGAEFSPRPLLILHGTDDDNVPVDAAARLAEAHGHAELRYVVNGARRLRHDPRAVAAVLGWLDRQEG